MSYSVLILDNKTLEQIYALNLKIYTGTDVIFKKNFDEVTKLIGVMPGIELIVARDEIDDQELGGKIYDFVKENDLNIPVIIYGSSKKYTKIGDFDKFGTFLTSNTDLRTFVRTCARHLGITSKDMASKLVPEYLAIPCEYLLLLGKSLSPLYVKRTEPNTPMSFEKVLASNAEFTEGDIQQLVQQGHKYIYIKSSERVKFVNDYTQKMVVQVLSKAPEEKKMEIMEISTAIILEQLHEIGVDDATLKIADSIIAQTVNEVKKEPQFKDFLAKLYRNTESFAFKHIQVITYLSHYIIQNSEWGTQQHQEKLAYAALFHDMALTDDNFIAIHTEAQIATHTPKLTKEAQALINDHAKRAAELIQKHAKAPYEVDEIVLQHHGSKTGHGFAKDFPGDLNRLSIVFIIAEEYALNLLKATDDPTKLDHQEAIFMLYEKYANKNYQNIIKTLGWMLLEKKGP
ncbi:MAG: hypothetical protein JNM93_06370 [Bacteriovoracaceae bacterium]|nr:hypothetical protein [Bacteriovoracaceae bacterium]